MSFIDNDLDAQQMFDAEVSLVEEPATKSNVTAKPKKEPVSKVVKSSKLTSPVTELNSEILKLAYQFTTRDGIYSSFFLTSNNVITTDKSLLFIGDCSVNKQSIPNGTIAASDIYKLLQVCKNNVLRWQDADNKVIVTTANFEYQIPKIYTLEIPSAELLFEERFTNSIKEEVNITEEVLAGLDMIQFCSIPSTSSDRLNLQGILFEKDCLYSSDAYGLAKYEVATGVKTPFVLPTKLSLFMTQFGLPPESCTLIRIPSVNNINMITNSYILVQYKKFKLLSCLSPLPFPTLVKDTFNNFTATHTLSFENLNSREKKEIIDRLNIVQENAVMFKRENEDTLFLTVVNATGYKVSEAVAIDTVSDIDFSFITGLTFFKQGFLKATHIKVSKLQQHVQLLFTKDAFSYLILGEVSN